MTDFPPVIAASSRFAPLAALTDRFFDIPTWKATVWHIPSVDESFLPYFAEALGISETEAWQRAQTGKARRALIQGAFVRQQQRGTATGLKREVKEAGGRVVRIVAPPNKTYLSAAASPAERNAWLALHPELRIYLRRSPGEKEGAFTSGSFLGSGCFPALSTALVRSRLRVTLVKNGIETELESPDWRMASLEKDVTTSVVIPSTMGRASFLGQPVPWVAATNASLRRVVFSNLGTYHEPTAKLGLKTVQFGQKFIEADAVSVAEVREAPEQATFLGKFPRFSARLKAELALYKRLHIFDPNAPLTRSRAASHLGYSRLTMPPHCAQIDVAFYGQRNPIYGRFLGVSVVAGDRQPLERLLANMRQASRLSDSITVNTTIFRPVRAGHVLAGSALAGGVSNK